MSVRIASIEHHVVEVELAEPFAIAGGSHELARSVLVHLTLEDGTLGLGEAAPLPAYNSETIASVQHAVAEARFLLEGEVAGTWRKVAASIASVAESSGSARCALETALLDALTRRANVPLFEWFGGMQDEPLVTDVTIPIGTPEQARRSTRQWKARGFGAFKIKVGNQPDDVERIRAVHAEAPEARLLLDANGALTAGTALKLWEALRQEQIDVALFEQPVARGDWDGLGELAQRGVRLALDESVVTARDALDAAQHLGPPHVINVKLMKAGIAEALDIVSVARARGMSLMIGGMVESELAMTVSACFAAGLGGFEFVDLDTHLFLLDSPLRGGLRMQGPRLSLTAAAGHGVSYQG